MRDNPVHIVILDGKATNPGDISWRPLSALGELTVYDRTLAEEIPRRASGAEIVITNKTPISRETMEKLPSLRYIGTLSTGFNIIDVEAARQRGIPVCNVPSYCTRAVAQMTFALLFALTNNVALHSDSVHSGAWCKSREFCYWEAPLVELEHKTMGILGYGSIGRTVAQAAQVFGMHVLVHSRTPKELPEAWEWVSFEELLRRSDVLSLHCPLTPQTERIINAQALSRMKPGAFLLNTARGGLLDEQAVADALNSGKLAGTGLDVLSTEPPQNDNPLLTAKNCVITPHIAWGAKETRSRLVAMAAENIAAFQRGEPQNVVNP